MSYTAFTVEQLAQVARAEMRQSEVLSDWLLTAHDRDCHHSNLSRVFTTGRDSYRVCRDCRVGVNTHSAKRQSSGALVAIHAAPAPGRAA